MAPTITRTAIVDDDGTLTTGTVVNNAWKQELYDQIDAVVASEDVGVTTVPHGGTGVATLAAHGLVVGNGASAVNVTGAGTAGQPLLSRGASADPAFGPIKQTTTLTGTQNDFALTAGALVLRCNNATLLTITGIAAGFDGQRLIIESVGAGQVDLSHQAAGSTAANRLINFATSGNTSLAAGVGTAEFEYDTTTARWRLVTHEQGAWIVPANPTLNGNGSMTWTSPTINLWRYVLGGRTVTVTFDVSGTVGGTPNTLLQATLPNGYTAGGQTINVFNYNLATTALMQVAASGTVLQFNKDLTAVGNHVAGSVRVLGEIAFEVQ